MSGSSLRDNVLNADHRVCSATETLSRLTPCFALFGITRVANVTGLDRIGLPVAMVCRPDARSSAVFHGKGLDHDTAKVSGVMEAIELWHAERIRGPLLYGSAHELGADVAVVDIQGLPRCSDRPISARDPLLWIEGLDLATKAATWVPFEIVHASSALDGPPASGLLSMDTNGLASGNTLQEAISHGCCEVIERDATSLWRGLRGPDQDRCRIDLDSVEDPSCRSVLALFAEARFSVAAWDVTTEIGVPAYYCLLQDDLSDVSHIGHGSGCHVRRDVALLRALTEAAQTRMTYIVGSREDIGEVDYDHPTLVARNRAARVAIGRSAGRRPFADTADLGTATLDGDVDRLLDRLAMAGFGQVVAVDLSRSHAGIAVARIVVPHLEGADHGGRFIPGPRYRSRQALRP